MTKAELVLEMAQAADISKAQAQTALEAMLGKVQKTLKKEGKSAIYGLGTFEVVKRAKRKGRNPQTGEPVVIKAHKAVKFRAAKSLKDFVN